MFEIDLNKNYTGIYMSVAFAKGKGETDIPYLADKFKAKGYAVKSAKTEKKSK